jgi:deferrochelatase/peroxidase EfeB
MLKVWTEAAAKMTTGYPTTGDGGEVLGLSPSRLTLTFGFGSSLFVKEGKDRYGLVALRPEALVDMPTFNGDQLVPEKTGGDISVQACADNPQVTFHAIRQLARLAEGIATLRWAQTGFISGGSGTETPRNLQGFKDGTQNPKPQEMNKFVWVSSESLPWMMGGSYVVVRRIRFALEHWDKTDVDFQEQVIGRHKVSGAPLGMKGEFDALDLNSTDRDGNHVIPENAHVRLAAVANNENVQILRRGYSYNDGANFTAERWPPWRQGIEYDAGLLFVAYQRDPRTGFIRMFDKISKFDALNQFVTHTGGGLFAVPPGVQQGEFIGQSLFKARRS